jgi:hypothetical protein
MKGMPDDDQTDCVLAANIPETIQILPAICAQKSRQRLCRQTETIGQRQPDFLVPVIGGEDAPKPFMRR